MPAQVDRAASVQREAAYYQAVEEFFVSRRGDPLLLSNADWTLVRKWRLQGLPLRVVLRGITDALDSHAHSWSRAQKVTSLSYCAAEVEAAAERWHRALALGTEASGSVTDRLCGFADRLQAAEGLSRLGSVAALEVAVRLRALAVEPRSQELEGQLGELEKRLLKALRRGSEPAQIEAIERGVDSDLAPYRGRMPERVLSQIRAESVARRLLESFDLPRLTLLE